MADTIVERLESCESFRVDAYCAGYPDVVFEIILDAVPTHEQTEIAVNALTKFVHRYNKFHFARWKVFVFIFSGVSINFRWVISENLVSVNMNIKSYSVHP